MSENAEEESVETRKLRQGTGPRAMVSVLFISICLAVIAGAIFLGVFYWWTPAPTL
jgi:hypothetical protein